MGCSSTHNTTAEFSPQHAISTVVPGCIYMGAKAWEEQRGLRVVKWGVSYGPKVDGLSGCIRRSLWEATLTCWLQSGLEQEERPKGCQVLQRRCPACQWQCWKLMFSPLCARSCAKEIRFKIYNNPTKLVLLFLSYWWRIWSSTGVSYSRLNLPCKLHRNRLL